jgi:hypothetical protein
MFKAMILRALRARGYELLHAPVYERLIADLDHAKATRAELARTRALLAEERRKLADALKHPEPPPLSVPDPARPSILINTLPKSGTIYVMRKVERGLDYELYPISYGYPLNDLINIHRLPQFVAGRCVAQAHLDPSPMNLTLMREYGIRFVLHLRDPRQALLSYVHHMERMRTIGKEALLQSPPPPLSAAYFDMPLKDKIDWQITNYYPLTIHWISAWMDVLDNDPEARGRCIITTYDELIADEAKMFGRIVDFLGIPKQSFHDVAVEKDDSVQFRSGNPEEWKSVFTIAQRERTTEEIPAALQRRFGWT